MSAVATKADKPGDPGRRHFLVMATTTVGLAGVVATAVPFLASWRPSARAKALGAPVEVDISKLEPGALMKIEWRGQAVYIVHRTAEMLAKLQDKDDKLRDAESSNTEQQPAYIKGKTRSIKPEYLVLVGVCTHLGCAPLDKFQPGDADLGPTWAGGFYCPCHGSKFDLSGRVFKDVPAPDNLRVPPYRYMSDTMLMIGSDTGVA
jgi:ubiquinol-cytochrome c reductase iron-sulfur subunit